MNDDIRKRAEKMGVRFWQIAQFLNYSDSKVTRLMRKELTIEEHAKFMNAIDILANKTL